MDSTFGDFQMEETNGKQYLVHHLDNNSGETKMSSGDIIDNKSLSVSTIFLCPALRLESFLKQFNNLDGKDVNCFEMDCSPYLNSESLDGNYESKRLDLDKHHCVFPLFWCKNRDYNHDDDDDDDDNGGGSGSRGYNFCLTCDKHLKMGTDYYFCVKCDHIYHKECVESPREIKHPYHPNHPLKLILSVDGVDCSHCRAKKASNSAYHCSLCNISMDIVCALKPIPFVIDQTKRHHHPLTFFTRKVTLDCNVCGLVSKTQPTYACFNCNFVSHQDCTDFPSIIRISRHHHRIYFTSSLPPGKWSCGVCRKNVDSEYGTYSCKRCDDYVVHPKCALRKDIWDGKDLEGEGVAEEDDMEEILNPFKTIGDGLVLHFLHDHCLQSETIGEVYDESKICHACVLPIYEGEFYACMECDFILHHDCANAPRKKQHPLHPHPLTLKLRTGYNYTGYFQCDACSRQSSGFVYECNKKIKCFRLDFRCGSISEPLLYQGHEHPLFLSLDPQEKHLCQVCQKDDRILINCIECNFIICLKCANLPYKVKYKHDKHFLTLVHGKETDDPNWCEVCEKLLMSSNVEEEVKNDKEDYGNFYRGVYKKDKGEDIEDKRIYECMQCCTTLHINCLLGKLPYMRPDQIIYGDTLSLSIETVRNSYSSRPLCHKCNDRCVDKIYYITSCAGNNSIGCCLKHRY